MSYTKQQKVYTGSKKLFFAYFHSSQKYNLAEKEISKKVATIAVNLIKKVAKLKKIVKFGITGNNCKFLMSLTVTKSDTLR